ncbi:BrnT family toxin, partial [Acinetobacter nosocomialis]
MEQYFEWDEAKNQKNQKKHDISFETASLIFEDPLRIS